MDFEEREEIVRNDAMRRVLSERRKDVVVHLKLCPVCIRRRSGFGEIGKQSEIVVAVAVAVDKCDIVAVNL